jgi:hypothetical protein
MLCIINHVQFVQVEMIIPQYQRMDQMVSYYRILAAEAVWRQDFPDLCWCMARRYGSRLSFFVNEPRLVRDQTDLDGSDAQFEVH